MVDILHAQKFELGVFFQVTKITLEPEFSSKINCFNLPDKQEERNSPRGRYRDEDLPECEMNDAGSRC